MDSSAGHEALRADGYRFVIAVEPVEGDFDAQQHLNNAAAVRLFNDLRASYVYEEVGPWWREAIHANGFVVAARELHVLYESEGLPGESFVGAMKYVRRDGKAAIIEEQIVEATTARPVARAWVVQLLVQNGAAVEWPARYFEDVERIEGRAIVQGPRREPAPWGPPE
jgi:acyl-CoA thioesterase FadM